MLFLYRRQAEEEVNLREPVLSLYEAAATDAGRKQARLVVGKMRQTAVAAHTQSCLQLEN